MTDEQGDRVIALLEAIARKLGARAPADRGPMTDEERAGWREVNRPARRAEWRPGDPPPSGGTPPEEFFARRPGRSV